MSASRQDSRIFPSSPCQILILRMKAPKKNISQKKRRHGFVMEKKCLLSVFSMISHIRSTAGSVSKQKEKNNDKNFFRDRVFSLLSSTGVSCLKRYISRITTLQAGPQVLKTSMLATISYRESCSCTREIVDNKNIHAYHA